MDLLGGKGNLESPIQYHQMEIITDSFWAKGEFESLGDPHLYLNQEDLTMLPLKKPQIIPWSFTGLPPARPQQMLAHRDEIQLLRFLQAESNDKYKRPPRTQKLFLYFPLFVVQGQTPLLSEADLKNFLDFWKGTFLPITDASIHYLTQGPMPLTNQAELLYINRQQIQGYFPAQEAE